MSNSILNRITNLLEDKTTRTSAKNHDDDNIDIIYNSVFPNLESMSKPAEENFVELNNHPGNSNTDQEIFESSNLIENNNVVSEKKNSLEFRATESAHEKITSQVFEEKNYDPPLIENMNSQLLPENGKKEFGYKLNYKLRYQMRAHNSYNIFKSFKIV